MSFNFPHQSRIEFGVKVTKTRDDMKDFHGGMPRGR